MDELHLEGQGPGILLGDDVVGGDEGAEMGGSRIGGQQQCQGDDEAEPLLREAVALTRQTRGATHAATGVRMNNLAKLLERQERYAEAEASYREALDTQRQLGNRTDEAIVSGNYAILLKTLIFLQPIH